MLLNARLELDTARSGGRAASFQVQRGRRCRPSFIEQGSPRPLETGGLGRRSPAGFDRLHRRAARNRHALCRLRPCGWPATRAGTAARCAFLPACAGSFTRGQAGAARRGRSLLGSSALQLFLGHDKPFRNLDSVAISVVRSDAYRKSKEVACSDRGPFQTDEGEPAFR